MARIVTRPAIVIPVDGPPELVNMPERDTLSFLQANAGRTVELARLGDIPDAPGLEMDVWYDEEGTLNGSPFNPLLSAFVSASRGYRNPLVGTGVVCASNYEGETVPLPLELAASLFRCLHDAWQDAHTPPAHTLN